MILDEFAGPGGWDEGLRMIGRTDVVGIEWDQKACETAHAAGHARIRADVSEYPSEPFVGKVEAYFSSPPCQAWSLAGQGKGELDRVNCHKLADRMAEGDDSTDWTEWEDPRSALVCQPIRRIRDLMPPLVALEEVPPVAPLWQHFAYILRGWGYSVWTGDLVAADYGVPQTRTRRLLLASLHGPVNPPQPTHTPYPTDDLFGIGLQKWVTMAEGLGWGWNERPATTVMAGTNGKYTGAEWGGSGVREAMYSAHGTPAWAFKRPATTVVGSFAPDVISAPGYRTTVSRQNAADSIRVSVSEAGVLQSFPADYPWQGSKTKQYEQVGNAVPPLLAAHVGAALGLGSL